MQIILLVYKNSNWRVLKPTYCGTLSTVWFIAKDYNYFYAIFNSVDSKNEFCQILSTIQSIQGKE